MSEFDRPILTETQRPHRANLLPEAFIAGADVNHGIEGLLDWLDKNLTLTIRRESSNPDWAAMADKALHLYIDRLETDWYDKDQPRYEPQPERSPELNQGYAELDKETRRRLPSGWQVGVKDGEREILIRAMQLGDEVAIIDYLFTQAEATPGHVISPDPLPRLEPHR